MGQSNAPKTSYRHEIITSVARFEPTLKQRFVVGITLMLVLLGLYLAINHGLTAGFLTPYDVSTTWDHQIPLMPGWVWIYALNIPMPMALILSTKSGDEYAELAAGFSLICLIAFVIFLVFPVTASGLRPSALGPGWSNWGLSVYYSVDGEGNCLPSLHVALCCYSGLWGLCRFSRLSGVFYFALGLAISVSTMLVKQHWIADVISGAILGFGVASMQLRGVHLKHYLPKVMRQAINGSPETLSS